MTGKPVYVVVPGALATPTGGFVFDRRMIAGLRRTGRLGGAIELTGAFPDPSPAALAAAARATARLPDGAAVVIDGLALTPLAPALAAERGRLALIALIHHPLGLETGLAPDRSARLLAAERNALALCRGAIVTSETTARQVEALGVAAERIAVVRPGVATARPRPPSASRRRGPRVVLSVATLTPRKGHDVLVRALAALRLRAWRLILIGAPRAPGFALRLRRLVRALGVGARVRILGAVSQARLTRAYRAADVFALASRHEGFGMAPVEAAAHGLPVVVTDAGALREALRETPARFAPVDDAPALAATLRPLVVGRARLSAAAFAARRASMRSRRWETAEREFLAAIGRMVAS